MNNNLSPEGMMIELLTEIKNLLTEIKEQSKVIPVATKKAAPTKKKRVDQP